MQGANVMREFKTKSPAWEWGELRGGTSPLPHRGLWLRFFHSHVDGIYRMGALLMESQPPFQVMAVSKWPILSGDDRYKYGWKFWKPRVVIPYGAIEWNGGWMVSIGRNDSECALVHVTPEMLNL